MAMPSRCWGWTDVDGTPEEFRGTVALITGAGAGIGLATAKRLAAGGATVVLTDKHVGRLVDGVAAVNAGRPSRPAQGHVLDIEERQDFDSVFTSVAEQCGPIGVYVWNAALNVPMPLLDYDVDVFDRITTANVANCWYSCRAVAKQMAAAGGGSVILVGSIAPDIGAAEREAPYAMSKAAGRALMLGLARAGGPDNIRCNEVVMAYVEGTRFAARRPDTARQFAARTPLGRNAGVDDIAEAIAYLASGRAAFVSGEVLNVTGAYYGTL